MKNNSEFILISYAILFRFFHELINSFINIFRNPGLRVEVFQRTGIGIQPAVKAVAGFTF